jgi:hypothetical protein
MAWVERFTCDVCGKLRGDSESWWVAASECVPASTARSTQPTLQLMPWENLLAHSAEAKHLCGAACVHTFLDRWMAGLRSGTENCSG